MSLKDWEDKVLSSPGAAGRVSLIEDELRLAAGLTELREEAGLSQRELDGRIGVSHLERADHNPRPPSRDRLVRNPS